MIRLSILHPAPAIRQDAIDAYREAVSLTPAGVHPLITETMRSFQKQNIMYAQGRTISGAIVTNARGGESFHNYGMALDFVMLINGHSSYAVDENFMIVVNCFKKRGFTWGGDFPGKFTDHPHLQKTLSHTWKELLNLYDRKKFIPVANWVDLTIT